MNDNDRLRALADTWESAAKPLQGYQWTDRATVAMASTLRACAQGLRQLLEELEGPAPTAGPCDACRVPNCPTRNDPSVVFCAGHHTKGARK